MLDTPILFLIFNRPEPTRLVFEKIREAKPKQLYIAADGPRAYKEDETLKCAITREIATSIDWDCQVTTLFRNENLGCGRAVSEAITWFFNQVEQGIILEDDCLPSLDFFTFCEKALNKYKDDKRIMMVSGCNVLGEWKSQKQSYHFSFYGGIWGWASWRRAWDYYDYDIKLWGNTEVRVRLKDILVNEREYSHRANLYDQFYNKEGLDTWDYQWGFARLIQSGLSIVPSVNLITNIGFGDEATHTHSKDSLLANLDTKPFPFSIIHPNFVIVDREYDIAFMEKNGVPFKVLDKASNHFSLRTFIKVFQKKLVSIISASL